MKDVSPLPVSTIGNIGRRGNLVSMLAETLEREILEGRYRPGDQLPTESSLASSAGVSRTVVREAVASLRAAGLVETRQGAGAFVLSGIRGLGGFSRIERNQIEDIVAVLELRLAVEVEAAALAAARRTQEDIGRIDRALAAFDSERAHEGTGLEADLDFHQAVAAATGNRYIRQFLSGLGRSAVPRSRLIKGGKDAGNLEEYLRFVQMEHAAVRDAIVAQDSALAAAAMRAHLAGSRSRYAAMLSEAGDK
jgi:DNA-binding FadR family transcriptional regulator